MRAGLDRGRARAIALNGARARELQKIVVRLALQDKARERPERGRAGRIAEQLEGLVMLTVADMTGAVTIRARINLVLEDGRSTAHGRDGIRERGRSAAPRTARCRDDRTCTEARAELVLRAPRPSVAGGRAVMTLTDRTAHFVAVVRERKAGVRHNPVSLSGAESGSSKDHR